MFHDLQRDPFVLGLASGVVTAVTLVDITNLDSPDCELLSLFRQRGDLGMLLFAHCCHLQLQEVAQRIDGHMNLRSLLLLGPVVPRSTSTFWRRLKRATIENNGRRLIITPLN
jgi:hypothetical protein